MTGFKAHEARETDFELGDIPPSAGGCWFCRSTGNEGLKFSLEFDAYYHESCAEQAGVADADDPILEWERSKL